MAAHPTIGGEDDELLLGGVVGVHLQAEAADTCFILMDLLTARAIPQQNQCTAQEQ